MRIRRLASFGFIFALVLIPRLYVSARYAVLPKRGNNSDAFHYCRSDSTTLLDWFSLNESEKQSAVESMRQSNISNVWVRGGISYSKFVYWEGCFTISESQKRTAIDANDIYHCDQFCGDQAFKYIGLSEQYCYCFTKINGFPGEDELYMTKCRGSIVSGEYCGSSGKVAVYGYSDVDINIDVSMLVASSQCVFLYRGEGTSTKIPNYMYGVDVCGNQLNITACMNGFLCEDQLIRVMNKPSDSLCIWQPRQYACIFYQKTSWDDARVQCANRNGRLVRNPVEAFYDLENDFQTGNSYWTGIFRTSVLLEEDSESINQYCIALDVHNREIVEMNCSYVSRVICMNESLQNNNETNSSDGNLPIWVIVLLILVAFVGLALAVYLFRNKIIRNVFFNRRTCSPANSYPGSDG